MGRREASSRAFEVILSAVHRYDGAINQFLGDGVTALFGASTAHDDDPYRAGRAAPGDPGGSGVTSGRRAVGLALTCANRLVYRHALACVSVSRILSCHERSSSEPVDGASGYAQVRGK